MFSNFDRLSESLRTRDSRYPDRGSEIVWLDEEWISEFFFDDFRIRFTSPVDQVLRDRESMCTKYLLRDTLIERHTPTENPWSDVGDSQKLTESLDRAIFTTESVDDMECDIDCEEFFF